MKRARTCSLPPQILSTLAQLQDGLNTVVDPSWRKVRTLDNWSLAITMETAELLDSYPWKWWKALAAKTDFNNVRIELTDIIHFSLSGTMQMKTVEESRIPKVCQKNIGDVFTPFTECAPGSTTAVDGLFFFPLSNTQNAITTFRNVMQLAAAYRFDMITEGVISAAEDLDFNLVAYYVAKHTLNCIRQLGGYKNGTYVKMNNGIEDNVLLHNCISDIEVAQAIDENSYVVVWNKIMARVYEAFQVPEDDRKDVEYWMTFRNSESEDAANATAAS